MYFHMQSSMPKITLIGMPFLIVTNGMSNLIRADGKPKYSMVCMVMGAIINTILDPIFIFACDWGLPAQLGQQLLGKFFLHTRTPLSMAFPNNPFWKRVVFIGHQRKYENLQHGNQQQLKPDCSYRDSNHSVQFVDLLRRINKIWNRYSLSCLRNRYENKCHNPCDCCRNLAGTQPIIGFNYGARQYHRVREAYLLAVKWNLVVSTIAFIAFQFFPQSIISLFGDGNELYFEFAVLFMRTYLFMVLVNGVQLLSSSFFTAIGKSLKGALLALTRQTFVLIPLTLLLPLRFGIMGVLLAGPVADFSAFMLSVVLVGIELKTKMTCKQQLYVKTFFSAVK